MLVERYSPSMLRIASLYTPSRAVAEDVVQETWLGVLQGLDRFEGRSSLKTWIFRILTNRAKTRGQRERRSIPFSSLADRESEGSDPAVDPSRFVGEDDRFAHGWASPPTSWEDVPEDRLLSTETLSKVEEAIAQLPEMQRLVITLRDIEGWSSQEVCNFLDLTETNQRVLLHRARSKVRKALEEYLDVEQWKAPA
ncbi:MAG TPA: sigma-70 family RNA polymerase sigma factor [Actinomycetota bacterium]|jgi:RNA polymerase sigma-70 factor (ECF subfamily)